MLRSLRSKLRTALFISAASAFVASTALGQTERKTDVTGKWLFTVTTDAGSGTPTVTFKQQGDSISGHYSSQAFGEVDFKGTVKDGKISFSFPAAVQGTNLTVKYEGAIEGTDAMKGTVDFGGYGGGSFSAKRQ